MNKIKLGKIVILSVSALAGLAVIGKKVCKKDENVPEDIDNNEVDSKEETETQEDNSSSDTMKETNVDCEYAATEPKGKKVFKNSKKNVVFDPDIDAAMKLLYVKFKKLNEATGYNYEAVKPYTCIYLDLTERLTTLDYNNHDVAKEYVLTDINQAILMFTKKIMELNPQDENIQNDEEDKDNDK